MANVGQRFGDRYTLLRRLAVGGMAEIYLARQAAMAGFEKEIVIKCLRPELADDSRIVEMFLDEARIGALLNHPNIVHVYDVDAHQDIPYIAMEYIIGDELNELCRRGLTHGNFLPLPHAVELIRQAAAGMGYFHAKRGQQGSPLDGESLQIVHCDISPSNLLVTEDGFLKIIDFGIAKSRGQRGRSEDVIPGKLSYMSPEQAARRPVDHRSDIFALGIVLYEITVGKRLFRGTAADVVARLASGKIEPPTFARREYPGSLEAIVMKALEHHPEDRYQSAYDLADDLEGFLREQRMVSGPVPIARYLDELTEAGGGARRPELLGISLAGAAGDDELDFDAGVFDGYQAQPGEQAAAQQQWEDVEERDAEIAAALGMELGTLQTLRTPVPSKPGSEPPDLSQQPIDRSIGDRSIGDRSAADSSVATVPGPPAAGPHAGGLAAPPSPSASGTQQDVIANSSSAHPGSHGMTAKQTVTPSAATPAPSIGAPWGVVGALAAAVIMLLLILLLR